MPFHLTQSKCQSPLTSHLWDHFPSYQPLTHSTTLHWPHCCSYTPGTLPTQGIALLQPLPRILFPQVFPYFFLKRVFTQPSLFQETFLTILLKIATHPISILCLLHCLILLIIFFFWYTTQFIGLMYCLWYPPECQLTEGRDCWLYNTKIHSQLLKGIYYTAVE